MDKLKNRKRATHVRSKTEAVFNLRNYSTATHTTTTAKIEPIVDDNDIKSTHSDEKPKLKPFITKMGFNMTDSTLDEKMNYLQSLFKNMNKKYAAALGHDKEEVDSSAINTDKFMSNMSKLK